MQPGIDGIDDPRDRVSCSPRCLARGIIEQVKRRADLAFDEHWQLATPPEFSSLAECSLPRIEPRLTQRALAGPSAKRSALASRMVALRGALLPALGGGQQDVAAADSLLIGYRHPS